MKCIFCSVNKVQKDQSHVCGDCIKAIKRTEVPPVDFKSYFIDDLESKLDIIDKLLMDSPENFFLWYMKGHLEHELGSSKKALNSIKTSISYKEDYGDPWIRLGLIYSDMHRESEAIENYKKGLRYSLMDPSNLVDAGISLQASENSKLASQILQRALDLVPDDDRAIVGLGKVHSQRGELEEAKEVLEKGLDLYPHNEEVLRAMAQIILRMEDLDSAMDMYSRILDQHPRDFEALLAKGEIHLRRNELGLAIKSYRAVKDLDIHISWSGILKFLTSSIRSFLEQNRNSLSYRDDLKKEFENLLLYVKEFEDRAGATMGSESLEDIEKIVKIIESQKLKLKEQQTQFKDLLERYKVEDSFHQHLQGKLKDLSCLIEEGRYFDAKQITLELSPFLSNLGKMNARDEEKIKKELKKKLEELKEIGKENPDLERRLDEVQKLVEDGNNEGATFMLKEVEISVEEYYIESAMELKKQRSGEMEELIKDARNKFDISGLKEIKRKFKASDDQGLKQIQGIYNSFMKRFEEDSSSYYKEETSKVLKEIDYKLVILEKDGMEVDETKEGYRDLLSDIEGSLSHREGFERATDFMKDIRSLEEDHKLSQIRKKLRGLDLILGEVDSLGMDDALAKNVEPVRRVIERSLKQNNYRLSEILTNEVYENVEKLLRENYLKNIKASINEIEGDIYRFKGLGIFNKEWGPAVERSKDIISRKVKGPMTEVVSHLSRINSQLQNFYIEKLPKEIDRKLADIDDLLSEAENYEIELATLEKEHEGLVGSSKDISTLDLLEDSYKLEAEIEKEIRSNLSDKVTFEAKSIREKVEKIEELSLSKKDLMKIISEVNRAEVLIESQHEREAFQKIKTTHEAMDSIWRDVLIELRDKRVAEIDNMIRICDDLDIESGDFQEDRTVISLEKEPDPFSSLELAEAIHNGIHVRVKDGCHDLYQALKEDLKVLLDRTSKLIPEDMSLEAREILKDMGRDIENERFIDMPFMVRRSVELKEDILKRAKETRYLDKCSEMLEIGFSLESPEAKDLITEAQGLADRIKKGEIEEPEKEMKELQMKANELQSIEQMQNIESMLKGIEEMDDVAREIKSFIEEDNDLRTDLEKILVSIGNMIDSTSKLYQDPDQELILKMQDKMVGIWEELEEIENKSKARRRIQILDEAGLLEGEISDRLLKNDIDNLIDHQRDENWTKFFRTWERIEAKIRKMKEMGKFSGVDVDTEPVMDLARDKGIEILSRAKSTKRKGYKRTGKGSMVSGIQKLAMDMAEKKKMIEEKKDPPVKEIKNETKEEPKEKKEENQDIAEIAHIIAGQRIEKLKNSRSKAIDEKDFEIKLWDDDNANVYHKDHPVGDLENLELDTSLKRIDIGKDIKDIREKLILFFEKLPENVQLEDAKRHFNDAEKLNQRKDEAKALKEYRRSLKLAIQVGKVHAEMGKSLKKIKTKLKELRENGLNFIDAEKYYKQSESLYKKGDLLGSAKKIKQIKEELTKSR